MANPVTRATRIESGLTLSNRVEGALPRAVALMMLAPVVLMVVAVSLRVELLATAQSRANHSPKNCGCRSTQSHTKLEGQDLRRRERAGGAGVS